MVFDTTMIGLNDSLGDLTFTIPFMGILVMMVGPEMHMVDLEFRYMLYNFRLSLVLEKYCGVDLGPCLGHKRDREGTPL